MTLPRTIVLGADHPEYPMGARAMARPPAHLLVKGALPAAPRVAIVGTRAASEAAVRFSLDVAGALVRAGITVWSGGACGIDAAAHRGAMMAGGKTVVVMGTGFGHLYPAENRDLFVQILEQDGAWISMYPEEQRGARWTFLLRNELLAALVDGVILVQAPVRSGARSTAAWARRLGRKLWVVPAAPWDPLGGGCLGELRLGGELLPPIERIVESMGGQARVKDKPDCGQSTDNLVASMSDLDASERLVLDALRFGSAHPDEICAKSGLAAREVAAALLTLSLRHVLVRGSDGRIHLAVSQLISPCCP